MDIYNSYKVAVFNCTFENNGPVNIAKLGYPWRGHSGGLSIASFFNESLTGIELSVLVRYSRFFNSTSIAPKDRQQTTSQLIQKYLPTGRGGGCIVSVSSVTPVNVEVSDCVFEQNHAMTYAGGLYYLFDKVSGHNASVNRVNFTDNDCDYGAGGMIFFFVEGGSEEDANQVFANDLYFRGNTATHGGGVYVFIAGELYGLFSLYS